MSKFLDGSGVSFLRGWMAARFALAGHSHAAATSTAPGLMSAADKEKLDGVAANATAYTHPDSDAAGAYGPGGAQQPGFGETFTVPSLTVDAQGHVSVAGEHTVTLPALPGEEETKQVKLLGQTSGGDPAADLRQGGYRGMLTRVNNPGRVTRIVAQVIFTSLTVSAELPTVHVGVLAGSTTFATLTYLSAMPFYATGSAKLPETGTCQELTFELDAPVDVADETLYVALWSEDGSGKWLNRNLNRTVCAATDDYPNYYVQRYSSSSSNCYVRPDNATYIAGADKAAALALYTEITEEQGQMQALEKRVDALEDAADDTLPLTVLRPDGGYCGIFHTITCIGDSLTAGVHEHNESGSVEYPARSDYSYPTYMARTLGNTVHRVCAGGRRALTTLPELTSAVLSSTQADAYIIALGTNDLSARTDKQLTGALTDINVSDPSLTDATTDVGAYGKIIQLIRAQAPKAKVFCVTIPHTRNSDAQIAPANALYRQIAELLGCYVIDLEAYGVQSVDETAWKAIYYTGGHLNTLGYKQLSVWMMSYIDWIIRHNWADFAQVGLIQTNYSYT